MVKEMVKETAATIPSGELLYDDKVIEKIVGYALENVEGLLSVDGGFFSNLKNKVVSTDDVTEGINVEVGKKQVAVDLNVVVEYGKHVGTIFDSIKSVIAAEIGRMTDLEVIEVNVTVVDIKTRAQFEEDSVTLQDKVSDVAHSTGEMAVKQAGVMKSAVTGKVNQVTEAKEPRVI
ncbi:Asp23/Gls24 family envelope stress response protein [Streptococcus fryi]